MKKMSYLAAVVLALLTLNTRQTVAQAQGTAFTYQGRLNSGGSAASGNYSLTFTLFATNSGGTAVAGPFTNNAVTVTNGLFTVQVDFGGPVFTGSTNWLQIGVATNGVTTFTPLTPRQALTPTPQAIFAESAGALNGPLSAAQLTSIGNTNTGASGNFFVGFSGNATTSGQANTANGYGTLVGNTSGSGNTANGYGALYSNTTGSGNTGSGYSALGGNSSGADNTANGYLALAANSTGDFNLANGFSALFKNQTGSANVANGYQALLNNVSGNNNVADGVNALYASTNGSQNTAVGYGALQQSSGDSDLVAVGFQALEYDTAFNPGYTSNSNGQNTAVGYQALQLNSTGYANTASGYQALNQNTIGYAGTAIGLWALYSNTTGPNNTASGFEALYSNTTGNENTANGAAALISNTTGSENTASGVNALDYNTTGSNNVASGVNALLLNTTGFDNVADGVDSLYASTSGSENTAVGYGALQNSTGDSDLVAVGFQALENDTAFNLFNTRDGNGHNTALGYQALQLDTSGYENTAVGYQSLNKNATGSANVAAGSFALLSNISGYDNIAEGYAALDAITNGTFNIAIGEGAGSGFAGNENNNIDIGSVGALGDVGVIRIGNSSYQSTTYIAGQVCFGYATPEQQLNITGGAVFDQGNQNSGTVANALRFGAGSGEGIGSTRVSGQTDTDGLDFYTAFTKRLTILNNGNIGIGTANPGFLVEADSGGSAKMTLDGSGNLECAGTVYSRGIALTSDRNAKENFKPVDNQTVLAKVAALPVTEWNYKTDSQGVQHMGPMAQDFQAAFGLDGKDDKHISVVDEGGVALAAIQGLNQKLNERDAEIEALKQSVAELKQMMQHLAEKK
jgi:hypothetical protein